MGYTHLEKHGGPTRNLCPKNHIDKTYDSHHSLYFMSLKTWELCIREEKVARKVIVEGEST